MNKIEDINILEKVNFKELRPLNLNDNKISDIKVFERVNFKNLEIIYIKDNNIDVNKEDFKIYINLEEFNNRYDTNIDDINIKELNLSGRFKGNELLKDLVKIKFKELKALNLSSN